MSLERAYRYQSEAAALNHWLQCAKDRLAFWTQQSVTVPQELEMVRDHLSAFLVSPRTKALGSHFASQARLMDLYRKSARNKHRKEAKLTQTAELDRKSVV